MMIFCYSLIRLEDMLDVQEKKKQQTNKQTKNTHKTKPKPKKPR